MTPSDILKHFYNEAPWLTDRFSKQIAVLSARVNDDLLLVVELDRMPDTLSAGGYLFIKNAALANPIVSVSNISPSVWRVVTEQNNFITTPTQAKDSREVFINGVSVELIRSVDSNTIDVACSSAPSGCVCEPVTAEFGYCKILSISGNVVTLQPNKGYLYPAQVVNAVAIDRLNFVIAKSVNDAADVVAELYDKCLAILIMGDEETVKKGSSAFVIDDSSTNMHTDLSTVMSFTVVVVWGSANNDRQNLDIEEAYSGMRQTMNRLFFGANLGRFLDAKSILPIGNGMSKLEDKSNYAHAYEYLVQQEIRVSRDGYSQQNTHYSVPIRFVEDSQFCIRSGSDKARMPFNLEIKEQ